MDFYEDGVASEGSPRHLFTAAYGSGCTSGLFGFGPFTAKILVEGRAGGAAFAGGITADDTGDALVVLDAAYGIHQRTARHVQVSIVAKKGYLLDGVGQYCGRIIGSP